MTATNIVFTDGTRTVTIGNIKIEEVLTKKLNAKITPPQSSSNYASGPKSTMLVDLLQIEHFFIITGVLAHSLGTSDSNTNPKDKKTDLMNIFKSGGVVTMSWEGDSFQVNLDGKLSFNAIQNSGKDTTSNEVGYDVMLTVIEGIDIGGA